MAYPVEKVRIAERNMLRASRDLLPHIRHNHVAAHNAEHAVVHRHNRAMPAQMLAPATGLRGSHNAISIPGNNQVRILLKPRHPRAIGHLEVQPLQRYRRPDLCPRIPVAQGGVRGALFTVRFEGRLFRAPAPTVAMVIVRTDSLRQPNQPTLKLSPQNCPNPKRPQILSIHRRIKSVTTNMRRRILLSQRRNQFRRQPRSRMHRQINRNQSSRANHALIQFLPRQVEARHLMPAPPQPSRWRHHPKRLPPQLIRRNQYDLHLPKYTVKRCTSPLSWP